MSKEFYWFEFDANKKIGSENKPVLKSGRAAPKCRKPDNGDIVSEVVSGKRKVLQPSEILALYFDTREAAIDFWDTVKKIIAKPVEIENTVRTEPEPKPKAEPKPEPKSEKQSSPVQTQKREWYLFEFKDGSLQSITGYDLIDDWMFEGTEEHIEQARKGEFPVKDLKKIAFRSRNKIVEFFKAFKEGQKKE